MNQNDKVNKNELFELFLLDFSNVMCYIASYRSYRFLFL